MEVSEQDLDELIEQYRMKEKKNHRARRFSFWGGVTLDTKNVSVGEDAARRAMKSIDKALARSAKK